MIKVEKDTPHYQIDTSSQVRHDPSSYKPGTVACLLKVKMAAIHGLCLSNVGINLLGQENFLCQQNWAMKNMGLPFLDSV
jgi:hypothetical protein